MHNILTDKDIEELREEFEYRSSTLKAEIANRKMIAAAHGDRSENAEYKEAMRDYHINQSRCEYLSKMLNTATVIEDEYLDKNVFNVGYTAEVRFIEDDEIEEVKLTTVLQADPSKFLISIESPLGVALYKKKVNTVIRVDSPDGSYTVKIEKILG